MILYGCYLFKGVTFVLAYCRAELFCSMYGYFPKGNNHRLRNFYIIVVVRGGSALLDENFKFFLDVRCEF